MLEVVKNAYRKIVGIPSNPSNIKCVDKLRSNSTTCSGEPSGLWQPCKRDVNSKKTAQPTAVNDLPRPLVGER